MAWIAANRSRYNHRGNMEDSMKQPHESTPRDKPISLAPLTLEQALAGAMRVPLPEKVKKAKPPKRKPKPKK